MSLLSVNGSVEYSVHLVPCTLLINTSDPIAAVLTTGYLNGSDVTYGITYANTQMALVVTSDLTTPVWLAIQIDTSSNINLVAPSAI